MSLLVATAILATGGVGLYMYKSADNETDDEREIDERESDTDSAGFFGKGGFFSSSGGDADDDDEPEHIKYEPKPKPRAAKTKRTRKNGGTKRRY